MNNCLDSLSDAEERKVERVHPSGRYSDAESKILAMLGQRKALGLPVVHSPPARTPSLPLEPTCSANFKRGSARGTPESDSDDDSEANFHPSGRYVDRETELLDILHKRGVALGVNSEPTLRGISNRVTSVRIRRPSTYDEQALKALTSSDDDSSDGGLTAQRFTKQRRNPVLASSSGWKDDEDDAIAPQAQFDDGYGTSDDEDVSPIIPSNFVRVVRLGGNRAVMTKRQADRLQKQVGRIESY
ncbi:hypothetical protein T439DRAFT_213205 [Meredithblackwellia eburnea MCA 4105]